VTSATDQNKAVVRWFMTEVLEGGNLDVIDDVLAPHYVNTGMGGTDLAAEGDAVGAGFASEFTLATGEKIDGRGMTFDRVADGRIEEDDPIETPDLTPMLAALMPQPGGAWPGHSTGGT
jgi:hypothetical protein